MRQLIDELKEVPGVIGACVYSFQSGLQESNLPAIFKSEKLSAVGKQLHKLYTAGRMNFADLTDLIFSYDESVIVARELKKNQLVFVICDPSFNQNLLIMSLNLLQEELETDRVETNKFVDGEKDFSQDFTELFENLKNRLVKIIGPMAGFIFDEAVDEWKNQGPATGSRLMDLLVLLEKEIADPDKIKRYQEMIKPTLQTFQNR